MRRCVILLTYWYPFTKYGEQFLDNEMKFLSENFDKVIIIPSYRTADSKYVRNIKYENIEIMRVERQHKNLEVVKSLGKVITSKNFWYEVKKLKGNLNNETVKSLLIATINQITIKNLVIKILKGKNVNSFDELTFYSYWFSSLAGVASDLRNHYLKNSNEIKFKVISRAHGTSDVYGFEHLNNYLPYREYYYNNLDMIYPVSNNATNFLSDKVGSENKLKTIYLGTKNYGLPASTDRNLTKGFKVISCSNLVDLKRVNLIIRALANIKNFKIEWVHFGGGPLEKEIKEQAKTLPANINADIRGAVPNQEIIDYYKNERNDVFINVSESEGIPVSVIEAMSFGLPIIATDVGGTSEAVENNFNGILLERDFKVNQLSDAITHFIEMDSSSYNDFSTKSRIVWENKFQENINHLNFIRSIHDI